MSTDVAKLVVETSKFGGVIAAEFGADPVGEALTEAAGFFFEALVVGVREAEGEGFGGLGHGAVFPPFFPLITLK